MIAKRQLRCFRVALDIVMVSAIILLSGCAKLQPPPRPAGPSTQVHDSPETDTLEVHLIPGGFIGPVVIVFEDLSQRPIERTPGVTTFRIPSSGILRTSSKQISVGRRLTFFYIDRAGRRTPLELRPHCAEFLIGDPVRVCLLGWIMRPNRPNPPYSAYLVTHRATGTPDEISERRWAAQDYVDSVARSK